MSTTIRAEISKKNPYWIEKHRYYELKHFCMQYPDWVKKCSALDGLSSKPDMLIFSKNRPFGTPTEECVMRRDRYLQKIDLLTRVSKLTDPVIGEYVLHGIIEGISYDILKARLNIPCCRDTYYELYRKFFWILDKECS